MPNIIFGAMYDDSIPDTAKITVIATGLDDATARQASVADAKKAAEASKKAAFNNAGFKMPTFQMPQQAQPQTPAFSIPKSAPITSNVPKKDIQIPDFLKNRKII